jgi:hypothetical protein
VRQSCGVNVLKALLGWLLLVSPIGQHPVPIKKWKKAGTYATEETCEYERKLQMAGAHSMFPNRGETEKAQPHRLTSSSISECVSDNDPRLN